MYFVVVIYLFVLLPIVFILILFFLICFILKIKQTRRNMFEKKKKINDCSTLEMIVIGNNNSFIHFLKTFFIK